jgi:hypothetical protein
VTAYLSTVARWTAATAALVAVLAGAVVACDVGPDRVPSAAERATAEFLTDAGMDRMPWPDPQGIEAREFCGAYAVDLDRYVDRVTAWLQDPPENLRHLGPPVRQPDEKTIRRRLNGFCEGVTW